VGSIDGTSRNNKRPAGVACGFQVRLHSVERQADDPSNVLAKEPSWSDLCNKPIQFRPEVAVIRLRELPPGDGKRLAGETARRDVPIVGNAGEAAGVGEAPDAGEEMLLTEAAQFISANIDN
jgi:hypothetical protein